MKYTYLCFCFLPFPGSTAQVGLRLLIVEVSESYSDTPQVVGLLWMSDWPVAETSTCTTLTTDRHPCSRWHSNPQSQQASGHGTTP